jgi:ATP/maltotriose-dependent transcriptional regulator MalT
MAFYYLELKIDLVEAANMCKKIISIAILTGSSKRHSQALNMLAWMNIRLGKYHFAQMYASEAQELARGSGNLYGEAASLRIQALCWKEHGDYRQSLSLVIMAQSLLALCSMSSSEASLSIMNTQAEVHLCKSEYSEARKIYTKMGQITVDRHAYWQAIALVNVAEIEVLIGVPKPDVQEKIDLARSMQPYDGWFPAVCDYTLGHLHLRERDLCTAQMLLEKCLL